MSTFVLPNSWNFVEVYLLGSVWDVLPHLRLYLLQFKAKLWVDLLGLGWIGSRGLLQFDETE